jgi:hypothetical protein
MRFVIPGSACLIGAWLLASVCLMWHRGFLVSLVLAIAWIWWAVYAHFANH